MKILIKNARVIDPLNDLNEKYDIFIKNGIISNIEKNINKNRVKKFDMEGKIILPGLFDMHTHLREPGFEEKETIKTGAEAAAVGGFTKIACMPNTNPAIDNPATVEFIKSKAEKAVVEVIPIGSITKKREGKELAEFGFLAKEGVKAVSDDGNPVANSEIMRRAMEYSKIFNLTIISHCEDPNLSKDGVMNEGYISSILGLKPIPSAAEDIMIARDIRLAEFTDAPLHIAHLSTARGLDLIKTAKKKNLKVTAEVTPHHLSLTEEAVRNYDPNTKVNPPLRNKNDVKALKKGIKDGLIDVIATDHAPHTPEDKMGEFDYAEFGISGLETALSIIYGELIATNIIGWKRLIELMLINPAKIMGVNIYGIKQGKKANFIIFDPEKQWKVNVDNFKSRGKNSPFVGKSLKGKNIMTFTRGKLTYDGRGQKNEIIY
ncbi:MAG: dihydroorotase [Bacillota bacterium]